MYVHVCEKPAYLTVHLCFVDADRSSSTANINTLHVHVHCISRQRQMDRQSKQPKLPPAHQATLSSQGSSVGWQLIQDVDVHICLAVLGQMASAAASSADDVGGYVDLLCALPRAVIGRTTVVASGGREWGRRGRGEEGREGEKKAGREGGGGRDGGRGREEGKDGGRGREEGRDGGRGREEGRRDKKTGKCI